MQIVIDIPDRIQFGIEKGFCVNGSDGSQIVLDAVKNGTPLPKGHGKIVDIGKIDEDRCDHDNPIIYLQMNGEYTEAVSLDYLNGLPVIVEADNEKG